MVLRTQSWCFSYIDRVPRFFCTRGQNYYFCRYVVSAGFSGGRYGGSWLCSPMSITCLNRLSSPGISAINPHPVSDSMYSPRRFAPMGRLYFSRYLCCISLRVCISGIPFIMDL